MRYLLKRGRKIKLLPAALPEEEDIFCGKCAKYFDSTECRRACFYICGHVACLRCILKMENGCEDCDQSTSSDLISNPRTHPVNYEYKSEEIPDGFVTSPLLNNSSEIDEVMLPEIKILSSPTIATSERVNEAAVYGLDEKGDRQFARELDLEKQHENQQVKQTEHDIPVIDLSVEDDIPVIDLSGDEEEEQFPAPSAPAIPHENDNSTVTSNPNFILPVDKELNQSILDTPPTSPEGDHEREPNCNYVNNTPEDTEEVVPARHFIRKRRKSRCFSNDTGNCIGFGRYLCRYCNVNGFIDKPSLGRHLYQQHWDIRPFPCQICDWPFVSQRNLDQHMLIHTNERSFKCNLCDTGYNRKYTLDKHLQKVHGMAQEKTQKITRKDKTLIAADNSNNKPCLEFQTNFEEEKAIPIPIPIPIQFHNEIDENYTPILHYSVPPGEMDENSIDDTDHYDVSKDYQVPPKKRRYFRQQHYKTTFDCQKVAYSECGHISCMKCVTRAELGCGQCTTEMVSKSLSPEVMEAAEQQNGFSEIEINSNFAVDSHLN